MNFTQKINFDEAGMVLLQTIKRFPVTFIFSICLFVCFALDFYFLKTAFEYKTHAILFLISGFFTSFAIQVFCEAHNYNSSKKWLLIIGVVFLLFLITSIPDYFGVIHIGTFIVSYLFAMVSAHIGRNTTDHSFWYYQYTINRFSLFGMFFGQLFFLGMASIFVSLQYLFGGNISTQVYISLWLFSFFIIPPFYLLSKVPKKFEFEKKEEEGLGYGFFLISYLMVPLCFLYLVILYIYAFKIGIEWNIPRNKVSYMVMGFGIIGLITWSSIFPYKEKVGYLTQVFYKNFFKFLFVPLGLLVMAIGTRILEYGVTEERAMICLFFIWLCGLSIFHTFFQSKFRLIHIYTSLIFISILGLLQPMHIGKISTISQLSRLEAVLQRNDMLDSEGNIQRVSKDTLTLEDRQNISSILDYLVKRKAESVIAHLLPKPSRLGRVGGRSSSASVMKYWGVEHFSTYQRRIKKEKWEKERAKE